MHVFDLPSELLLHILHYLGADFFAQDVGRLLVSKQWYFLAWQVPLGDLRLSFTSLRMLLATLRGDQQAAASPIRSYTRSVTLRFPSVEEWRPLHAVAAGEGGGGGGSSSERRDTVASWTDPEVIEERGTQVDTALSDLAGILDKCPRMRSLRVEAHQVHFSVSLEPPPRYFLRARSLSSLLLSMKHLAALDFDITNMPSMHRVGGGGGGSSRSIHYCSHINALLPTLRRLRCRMGSVCGRLLHPPPGDAKLALSVVLVNLSISSVHPTNKCFHYAASCQPTTNYFFPQLNADVEAQAARLVARLSNPEKVRVLAHTFPPSEVRSFDALAGVRMRLGLGSRWDDDGEVMEEDNDGIEEGHDDDEADGHDGHDDHDDHD